MKTECKCMYCGRNQDEVQAEPGLTYAWIDEVECTRCRLELNKLEFDFFAGDRNAAGKIAPGKYD